MQSLRQLCCTSLSFPRPFPVGSSPTPSPTAAAQPYGVVRDLAVLDCNGGLHLLPGHPLETNVNLRGFKKVWDIAMQGVVDKARCAAGRATGCSLSDEDIERHFVPSIPMILNYYAPAYLKRSLPASCQAQPVPGVNDGIHPVFPRTFWDDSAWSTVILPYIFNYTRFTPQFINFPDTCTYDTYIGGVGCTFSARETVTGTQLQVGVDRCPNSFMPYVSITCRGDYCQRLGRPCEPDDPDNVAAQCGPTSGQGTNLICRSTEVQAGSESNDQLVTWMRDYGVLGDVPWEQTACAGSSPDVPSSPITSRVNIYAQLRDKLMRVFNSSWPSPRLPQRAMPDLSFCLPSDAVVDAINAAEFNMWRDETYIQLGNTAAVAACTREECDVLNVGNGRCDAICNVAECAWDGGDCGGPPKAPTPVDPAPYFRDTQVPPICLVTWGAGYNPAARDMLNYWEPCNGAGMAACNAITGCSQAMCGCNAPNLRFNPANTGPSGDSGSPGVACENCNPPIQCVGQSCQYAARGMRGVQDRMTPWTGMLWDGSSVLSFDRKSGLDFKTPAASFEIEAALNAASRPVMQMTCSGEIGITGVNGFLQAGIHMPFLQDGVSFLAGWIQDRAQCRLTAFNTRFAPLPPSTATTFTFPQLDMRFFPQTVAFWFYQYTHFGPAGGWGNGNTPVPNNWGNWGLNSLWETFASGRIGVDRSYGNYMLNDIANATWGREPAGPVAGVSPVPTPLMQDTRWGKTNRFIGPLEGECNLLSATDRQTALGGNRRCRAQYVDFGRLFPDINNNPAQHNLHLDIRHDGVCEGAPTGQLFPIPTPPPVPSGSPQALIPAPWPTPTATPTLAPLDAKRAFPLLSLVYEGAATRLLSQPRACRVLGVNSPDCVGPLGAGASCVDLDDVLGITPFFNERGRNVDPFGMLVYGMYNVARGAGSCLTSASLRGSLRKALMSLAGRPYDGFSDMNFCFMNPTVLKGVSYGQWQETTYNGGTCTMYQENGPEGIPRNCLRTRNIDPNPTTSPRPQGIPARLNIAAPSRDWISRPAAMGFMRMIPTNRQAGTFPQSAVRQFTLSMPTWTVALFTNSVKERLRYTIADALSRPPIQLSISPDNVLIDSVIDVPQNFLPLPTGARAGVQIQFTLDCPDVATADAITVTLQSNAIGTLGGNAGATFATYGLVPFLQQREVVFRQIFPQPPAAAAGAGGAAAGAIVVIIILGAGGVWAFKTGRLAGLPFMSNTAPRKAAARKSMGGVVEDIEPTTTTGHDSAPAVVTNPAANARALAVAAATAMATSGAVAAPAPAPAAPVVAASVVAAPEPVVAAPEPVMLAVPVSSVAVQGSVVMNPLKQAWQPEPVATADVPAPMSSGAWSDQAPAPVEQAPAPGPAVVDFPQADATDPSSEGYSSLPDCEV